MSSTKAPAELSIYLRKIPIALVHDQFFDPQKMKHFGDNMVCKKVSV